MSKRVKVFISVLVVALLLTVGATATVMAEGEEETTPPPEANAEGLLERVADILGIDKEDLIGAFKQAQQEIAEEAFISRLNKAVEGGCITREQADGIIEWWELRPEVLVPGMYPHAFGLPALRGRHIRNGPRGWFCPRPPK